MNKNVKRIVALAVAFGTVSALAPATSFDLLTTKVYAATTNSEETLDSLEIENSSGNAIKLYSKSNYDSDYKVDSKDVLDGDTYYTKTSSNTISINTDGPSSKYVKVFKGTSSSTKGKSEGSDISLSSGTNIIVVKVYSSAPDSTIRYDEDDDVVSKYTIRVNYTGSDSTSSSDSYDEIYLDNLSVGGSSISLSKSKTTYDYSVKDSVNKVTIKAEPEDNDYDVTINGSTVDDSDDYEDDISLNKGKNEIKVKIKYDGDERVYTLNITRGSTTTTDGVTTIPTATTTPSTATNVDTTNLKAKQWVKVNGVWKYNDDKGVPMKNSWFYDQSLGKTYYLQDDGSMATGWKTVGGSWYYLGDDGAKRTGWQSVGGSWYYLNGQGGSMAIGWIKDGDNYYYLNSNGSMAYSTTIQGYKLGANGAWTK